MITKEQIQQTKVYQSIDPSINAIRLQFINSLSVQKILNHGYTVAVNTGAIPGNITGINKLIIEELIKTKKNEKQSK